MTRPRRKPPIRSLTGWRWHGGSECDGDWTGEREVEHVLREAKSAGIVRGFGVGACGVWVDAAAGPEARAVRDRIDAMVPAEWTRGEPS
jgi:hypothetical protein